MTKATAIRNYRKFSAADMYAIGFIYKHDLYVAYMEEIAPRYMKVEHESSKKGGKEKLQLRLNNNHMEQLIRKGAERLGSEDLLIGEYNKGVQFEKLITESFGQEFRGKDSVGFWVAGDISTTDHEIQVKLNGAQIVVFSTLERLKKG